MGYSDVTGKELQRQVLLRARQLPGVQSATMADFAPLTFTIHSDGVFPEGYLPRLHDNANSGEIEAQMQRRLNALDRAQSLIHDVEK